MFSWLSALCLSEMGNKLKNNKQFQIVKIVERDSYDKMSVLVMFILGVHVCMLNHLCM